VAIRVCLLAALPLACATTLATRGPEPAPAPEPAISDDALFGIARIASVFDLRFAPELVDRMVRWQRDVRDTVRAFEDRLAAMADAVGIATPDLSVLTIEPVANSESSGFGWRDDPIRHTRAFHSGTDFRGHPGTPVVAAGDGVVLFCGRLGGYGNVIDIDHGGGVMTRYAHLRRIATAKDSAITAGATIGQLGSTGRATGPHLHFEVRLDGAPVSPIAALTVAALQRESPLLGRLAALSLSPGLQSAAQSEIDPPRQRGKSQRPERPGRAKRRQVLW
jgi:murein DD-endopeptidase MepM/ murein hydrolase activator NlpD